MTFLEIYQQNTTSQESINSLANKIATSPKINVDSALNTPENIWKKLNRSQRALKYAREWTKTSIQSIQELAEEDYLIFCYPELNITKEESQILISILRFDEAQAKNPSLNTLVPYLLNKIRKKEPINLLMTQCLERVPTYREDKLRGLSVLQQKPVNRKSTFVGLQKKGWDKLRELINTVNFPINVEIFLGDMDFYTTDQAQVWLDSESIEIAENELKQIKNDAQEEVDRFFGENKIKIRRWSEIYNYQDFERELEINTPILEKIMRTTRSLYYGVFKYMPLGESMGLGKESTSTYVDKDIQRRAVSYSVEARIIREQLDALTVWAEMATTTTLGMDLSNYSGSETNNPSITLI